MRKKLAIIVLISFSFSIQNQTKGQVMFVLQTAFSVFKKVQKKAADKAKSAALINQLVSSEALMRDGLKAYKTAKSAKAFAIQLLADKRSIANMIKNGPNTLGQMVSLSRVYQNTGRDYFDFNRLYIKKTRTIRTMGGGLSYYKMSNQALNLKETPSQIIENEKIAIAKEDAFMAGEIEHLRSQSLLIRKRATFKYMVLNMKYSKANGVDFVNRIRDWDNSVTDDEKGTEKAIGELDKMELSEVDDIEEEIALDPDGNEIRTIDLQDTDVGQKYTKVQMMKGYNTVYEMFKEANRLEHKANKLYRMHEKIISKDELRQWINTNNKKTYYIRTLLKEAGL